MQSTIKNYDIEYINIDSLEFDKTNPNKLTDKQMDALRQSMLKYGYLTPVIVDQDNKVADGEHRALVYKQLGYDKIPVFKVNLETDTDRKILRQVMNKLHGEHDKQLDSNELLEVFQQNKLTDLANLIAQEQYQLQQAIRKYHPDIFFEKQEGDFDLDKTLEEIVPTTQLGDLYQLGNHRLICADCSDKRSISKLTEGKEIDLLLTDPPYGVNIVNTDMGKIDGDKPIAIGYLRSKDSKPIHMWGKIGGDHLLPSRLYRSIEGDNKPFDPSYLIEMSANHKIIFGANYFADKLKPSSGWIVWLKKHEEWDRTTFADCELAWTDFDMPARVYRVIWMGIVRQGDHTERVHPTQKPINLMAELINDFSKENANILDPYSGSGSILVASEQTKRNCYAVEIDPLYCDVIISRWEKYTNKKAVKISN